MNCDSTKLPLLLINLGLVFLYYKNQSLDIQDSYNIKGRILGITASALLQTARPSLEKSAASYLNEDSVKHLFDASPFVMMGGIFAYTGLARQVNLFATTLFGIQHLYIYATLSSDLSLSSVREEGPSLSQSRFSLLFSASMALLYWQCQKPDLMYSKSVIIRVMGIAFSFLTQDRIHSHLEKPKEDYKKWIFDALPFVIMGATFALTHLAWRVNLLATLLLGRQQLYVHSSAWKEPLPPPPIPEVQPDPVTPANLNQAEITIRELQDQLQETQNQAEEQRQNGEHLSDILKKVAEEIHHIPPADEDQGDVPQYTHLVEGLHIYWEEQEERIESQKIEIKELSRKVEEKMAEIEKKQHDFEVIKEAFGLEITKKTQALEKEHQITLESEKERFESRRGVLSATLDRERVELENLKKSHGVLEKENASLGVQLSKVDAELQKAHEKLNTLLAQNSSEPKEDSHADDLEREISLLKADTKRLQDEMVRLKEEKARSEATCLLLDEQMSSSQASVEDLKQEKKKLEDVLEKAQARIRELRKKQKSYIKILEDRLKAPLSNSLSLDEIGLVREHFNAEDE